MMRKQLEAQVSSRKWTCMITPTTHYPYTPRGVKKANEALSQLLRMLRDDDPDMKYHAVMDINKRGRIHFHIAYDGDTPRTRRLKARLRSLTGCFNLKVTPAHSNLGYYLARRASQLPHIKDDRLPAWRGVTQKGFRRTRRSEGLYPTERKAARDEQGPWLPCFVSNDYPEELLSSYSMAADTALPREAGDTADRPTLTGEVHGHEGERRRHGVLVQDVRTRTHRRRSGRDSRELDAHDETPGRAVVGASQ